jgi:hypothetical protein
MAGPDLTPQEERIVERYVSVLDFLSRCAQAIDEGNTYYLWDKTGQLLGAVERLKEELDQTGGKPQERRELVAAAVRYHARHHRAGRLLHPPRAQLTAGEVGSIMLAVAGADAFLMDDSVSERIRQAAMAVAERTDVPPEAAAQVLCALRSWELRERS